MTEGSLKFQFFMSRLTHVRDVKDTERTHISIVFYEANESYCVLRQCKGRNLSAVCHVLCKLRHPNAVVVYDYIYENGDTYILEENIAGTPLEEIISDGRRFSPEETAQIMLRLCSALEPLHGQQPPLVHNDINPSNIMLREDGSVKLFDFDISRIYKQGAGRNTALFGTEEYASPEHYGYGQSEPRTDIYCMGVTMHKMLTGESLTVEHQITYRGKLRPILEKCLRLDPQNRYADVKALSRDLEGFLSKKKRWLPWSLAGAVGVLLSLLLWGVGNGPAAKPEPPETKQQLQTQQPQPSAENEESNERPIGLSEEYTVTVDATSERYLVLTVPETGKYAVTLNNRSADCRVFFSGQRNGGSLFSGWADQGESATRTFRAQKGDTVFISVRVNDPSGSGECGILAELS